MPLPEGATDAIATTTAGLQGSHWRGDHLPDGVSMTAHSLRTEDGASVTGYLFSRGGERSVCCAMHPREMVVTSYLVPEVLRGGAAMWVMGARTVGNDIRLEHETAVHDLAAGQRFLRDRGFAHRILVGTSGGAALAALYNQQAALPGEARIQRSPGGRPTKLEQADLPLPSGLVFISPHLGPGELLVRCIDPSVVDERDPLQTDESLSAFHPGNGWHDAPRSASYSTAFVERYRAAQHARVARIDAFAQDAVARKQAARRRVKERGDRADAVLAAWSPIFNVWRTDADLRCFDLSLDPSDRAYGTLWGADPIASNYGSVGFARVCTPESWLSNWSAHSSNASMLRCAESITQPTLMIEYTGDNSVFPADAQRIFDAIGVAGKQRARIRGNHQGGPIRKGEPGGQQEAGARIREWLEAQRFV
ncbi:alpha/beta hydrolase [Variovorax sp. JS1663]|uniref:alpha/beta hydrolase n=1 Tax=Variovorax sp. JS1663 TaxID=1851577 RepID=UPI000B74064C|nr:alpha/beta hydrolase [Variovorax sp. JS1663]OUM02452.1 alpha/beta hydrolase [Variovorax sp. JS1663]OUM02463.1 alpha/beta hydrolase [Variovorax sp. JS1663]